jgi:hypothetical protein
VNVGELIVIIVGTADVIGVAAWCVRRRNNPDGAPHRAGSAGRARRRSIDAAPVSRQTKIARAPIGQRSGRRSGWLGAAPLVVIALASCSNDGPTNTPPPGGTRAPSSDATVRAPNGTNMGAPPINAGTAAP